jgi:CRP-like cAMP-binding protein
MARTKHISATNSILEALPSEARQRVLAACESVELLFGDVLAEPGEPLQYVYFPTEGFISLVARVDGRSRLEVGLVGNEGMLGATLLLGVDVSPLHALVQGSGEALRMDAAIFGRELNDSPALQGLLKRYLFVGMEQLAQTAACTHFHVVEERLARWLLMTQDRAHSNEFHITQEFLAFMLGVRRVGVTTAAISLHNRKLINYSRGDITVLNRLGLEAASCGCFKADKASYVRIMGSRKIRSPVVAR